MTTPTRKVALVTAGSAGLGAAIARVLALELGMNVTINYNSNADRANALVQELQDAWAARQAAATTQAPPPVFHAIRADISKRSEIIRLVEETTTASGGRLDAVISNVGWTRMRDFSDLEDGMDDEDWDRCFGANVKAHLWLFHAAKKWLEESNAREEGSAVFVSTASVAGCKPSGSSLVRGRNHEISKIALHLAAFVNSNRSKTGVAALRGDEGGTNPPH
jgi:NAD(P)-dependent dehydrogenase (short-subunit alcohol dehydrogenase family)